MVKRAMFIGLALWLVGCASWQPHEKWAVAAEAADVITTAAALDRSGTHEANPIYGDKNVVVKSAILTLGIHVALHYLLERTNPPNQELAWNVDAALRGTAAAINAWNAASPNH